MAVKQGKFKKLKKVSLREGLYPVEISLSLWDDGKSKPFIDMYRGVPGKAGKPYQHHHFTITSKQNWNTVKKIVEEQMLNGLSKNAKPLPDRTISKQVNTEVERLKEDNIRLSKMLKQIPVLVKEHRTYVMDSYDEDIKKFEKLLKTAKLEGQLQKFLSERPWLLGLEYENSQPQKIGASERYDFYVEKYDGFADIIEIKKVSEELFDKEGKITKKFSDAIQQLIQYIDNALYFGNDKRLSQHMKFNFLKPKGILIIGRTDERERLINLQYYFHNIEILSYQDVLLRGKNIVKRLKAEATKKKRKRKSKTTTEENI